MTSQTTPQLGTLYLIPNTLGVYGTDGAQDSLRAVLAPQVVETTARLQHFVVETAKVARQFLKAVGTQTPLQQLQLTELNVKTPDSAVNDMLAPLLAGHDVGLLSDAGCPAVADPGARLVEAAHAAGVRVVPLVGPSSLLLALMGSGLNGQKFAFHGYLPIDAATRLKELKRLESESKNHAQTQLFIETPYRNMQLFDTLLKNLNPNTKLCVAVDLTLPSELIRTRTVAAWREALKKDAGFDLNKRPSIFLFLA